MNSSDVPSRLRHFDMWMTIDCTFLCVETHVQSNLTVEHDVWYNAYFVISFYRNLSSIYLYIVISCWKSCFEADWNCCEPLTFPRHLRNNMEQLRFRPPHLPPAKVAPLAFDSGALAGYMLQSTYTCLHGRFPFVCLDNKNVSCDLKGDLCFLRTLRCFGGQWATMVISHEVV